MDKRSGQFVIQQHTAAEDVHWDLMLEAEQVLWTWRIPVPPEQIGREPVSTERIADHPLRFLTYEGPVQQETGQVRIIDSGKMSLRTEGGDCLFLELQGKILSGSFELIHQEQNRWLFRPGTLVQSPYRRSSGRSGSM